MTAMAVVEGDLAAMLVVPWTTPELLAFVVVPRRIGASLDEDVFLMGAKTVMRLPEMPGARL